MVRALRALEAGPDLVPYTLSARAFATRRSSTRYTFCPDSRAHPAELVDPRRRASHRSMAAPRSGRPRNELSRSAEPPADDHQRVRLLLRAISGAVHSGG